MRYFLISYIYKNDSEYGYGNYYDKLKKFPSKKEVENFLLKQHNNKEICIQSIFEFKNGKDYLEFTKR